MLSEVTRYCIAGVLGASCLHHNCYQPQVGRRHAICQDQFLAMSSSLSSFQLLVLTQGTDIIGHSVCHFSLSNTNLFRTLPLRIFDISKLSPTQKYFDASFLWWPPCHLFCNKFHCFHMRNYTKHKHRNMENIFRYL